MSRGGKKSSGPTRTRRPRRLLPPEERNPHFTVFFDGIPYRCCRKDCNGEVDVGGLRAALNHGSAKECATCGKVQKFCAYCTYRLEGREGLYRGNFAPPNRVSMYTEHRHGYCRGGHHEEFHVPKPNLGGRKPRVWPPPPSTASASESASRDLGEDPDDSADDEPGQHDDSGSGFDGSDNSRTGGSGSGPDDTSSGDDDSALYPGAGSGSGVSSEAGVSAAAAPTALACAPTSTSTLPFASGIDLAILTPSLSTPLSTYPSTPISTAFTTPSLTASTPEVSTISHLTAAKPPVLPISISPTHSTSGPNRPAGRSTSPAAPRKRPDDDLALNTPKRVRRDSPAEFEGLFNELGSSEKAPDYSKSLLCSEDVAFLLTDFTSSGDEGDASIRREPSLPPSDFSQTPPGTPIRCSNLYSAVPAQATSQPLALGPYVSRMPAGAGELSGSDMNFGPGVDELPGPDELSALDDIFHFVV